MEEEMKAAQAAKVSFYCHFSVEGFNTEWYSILSLG